LFVSLKVLASQRDVIKTKDSYNKAININDINNGNAVDSFLLPEQTYAKKNVLGKKSISSIDITSKNINSIDTHSKIVNNSNSVLGIPEPVTVSTSFATTRIPKNYNITLIKQFFQTQRSNVSGANKNSAEIYEDVRTGPYFDRTASKNVTALLGKTAYLNCRVKNLGNKTVRIIQLESTQ